MTTSHLKVVDNHMDESLTSAVARRLRGQLAERNITKLQLAEMTGLARSSVLRRLSGETAINTDELEVICAKTGINLIYLLTGTPGTPGGGDGGQVQPNVSAITGVSSGKWAPRGSNPEPADSESSQFTEPDADWWRPAARYAA